MKDAVEDLSESSVEMKQMMTADENTDVSIPGYGNKASFSKQLKQISQKYVPLGPQYNTLAEAQAAVTAGTIKNGDHIYIRGTTDATLADEYVNNSGTLQPTGRQMPSEKFINDALAQLSNLMPLNQTSKFFVVGVPGSEFEAISDTEILLDKDGYVIRAIRDGVYTFFMPVKTKQLATDSLTVGGVAVDPTAIPPAVVAVNLSGLAESSFFMHPSSFAPGGEFEAWANYSNILLDKDKNFLGYIKDGIQHWLLPYNLPALDTKQLSLNGVDILDIIDKKDANRIPYAKTVSGKSQVFLFDNTTGDQKQVTDGTANETNPLIDDGGFLEWTSDRDPLVPGGKFFLDSAGVIRPMISRSILAGWGDSFMENPVFMDTLHSLTGLTAYNFGKSGLRSTAVASRQGGAPFYCMPVGGVIPASGTVNLTPNGPGPDASASNGAMPALKCRLAGVEGTFNWDGTQASFTRDTAGSAVSVPVLTPLYVYPITTSSVSGSIAAGVLYEQHVEAIHIITCGRNNTASVDEVVNSYVSIVDNMKPRGKRFVACPQFTRGDEIRGTEGYARIAAINTGLKQEFPNHYCQINGVDLMQNFKNHYNPANATDVQNIADDTTPASLKYDTLHPSQTLQSGALYIGAQVNGSFVNDFIRLKGWVD